MNSALQTILPALVAAIVGILTVWLGLRQLRETSRIAIEQLALSAKTANEQVAAQLSAAHLSYRAQVLSANRQAWINDVRNAVSEAIAIMERHRMSHADDDITWETVERFERCFNRLRLLLNPVEAPSMEIVACAQKLRECAEEKFVDHIAYANARDRLFAATSRVLKEEWERVKRGA